MLTFTDITLYPEIYSLHPVSWMKQDFVTEITQ